MYLDFVPAELLKIGELFMTIAACFAETMGWPIAQ